MKSFIKVSFITFLCGFFYFLLFENHLSEAEAEADENITSSTSELSVFENHEKAPALIEAVKKEVNIDKKPIYETFNNSETTSASEKELNITFEMLANNGDFDTNRIDQTLVDEGTMFFADTNIIEKMEVDNKVSINLYGIIHEGVLSHKKINNKTGHVFAEVDFSGSGEYMTFSIGKRVTKGKIYLESDAFMYEKNDDVGFIMPIFEYKKLNNALFID